MYIYFIYCFSLKITYNACLFNSFEIRIINVTLRICPFPMVCAFSTSGGQDEIKPPIIGCWLGFASDMPAAFFLCAAIWDKTLSALPP